MIDVDIDKVSTLIMQVLQNSAQINLFSS